MSEPCTCTLDESGHLVRCPVAEFLWNDIEDAYSCDADGVHWLLDNREDARRAYEGHVVQAVLRLVAPWYPQDVQVAFAEEWTPERIRYRISWETPRVE